MTDTLALLWAGPPQGRHTDGPCLVPPTIQQVHMHVHMQAYSHMHLHLVSHKALMPCPLCSVEAVVMSAGELEHEDAGTPGRLIRERYRKAADMSKVRGKVSEVKSNLQACTLWG